MISISRIVLADDDSEDAYLFKESLKEIDPSIQLEIARNGNGLMSLLDSLSPDFIFLDLDLPYKNGLECLAEMKSKPSLEQVPKIIFSSTNKLPNIQQAYEMGAHLFITKGDSLKEQYSKLSALFKLDWEDPDLVREQYFINDRHTAFI